MHCENIDCSTFSKFNEYWSVHCDFQSSHCQVNLRCFSRYRDPPEVQLFFLRVYTNETYDSSFKLVMESTVGSSPSSPSPTLSLQWPASRLSQYLHQAPVAAPIYPRGLSLASLCLISYDFSTASVMVGHSVLSVPLLLKMMLQSKELLAYALHIRYASWFLNNILGWSAPTPDRRSNVRKNGATVFDILSETGHPTLSTSNHTLVWLCSDGTYRLLTKFHNFREGLGDVDVKREIAEIDDPFESPCSNWRTWYWRFTLPEGWLARSRSYHSSTRQLESTTWIRRRDSCVLVVFLGYIIDYSWSYQIRLWWCCVHCPPFKQFREPSSDEQSQHVCGILIVWCIRGWHALLTAGARIPDCALEGHPTIIGTSLPTDFFRFTTCLQSTTLLPSNKDLATRYPILIVCAIYIDIAGNIPY